MKSQPQVYAILEVFLKKHHAEDVLKIFEKSGLSMNFFRADDGQQRHRLNFAPH
jgi:hypothetical protein